MERTKFWRYLHLFIYVKKESEYRRQLSSAVYCNDMTDYCDAILHAEYFNSKTFNNRHLLAVVRTVY
jgi:hypothetical protein